MFKSAYTAPSASLVTQKTQRFHRSSQKHPQTGNNIQKATIWRHDTRHPGGSTEHSGKSSKEYIKSEVLCLQKPHKGP